MRFCYSVTETAQLLGVCKDNVYRAVREGQIPHLTIGHKIVIPHAALVAMFGEPGTNVTHDVAQDAVA